MNDWLQVLACPLCQGALIYSDHTDELICRFDHLAFPIRDQIPVMLVEEAREIREEKE